MATELWDPNFEIRIDSGDHFKTVGNSREALESLMTCWPETRGKKFKVARRACLGALNGNVPTEQAAEAFRIAAKEAGILRPK